MFTRVCRSMLFYRVILCVGALLLLFFTEGNVQRIAPFAAAAILAISAGLLLLKNTRRLTLPFLLLSLLLIFCYDSFHVFIGYVWLLPIALVAIAVHIIRLRPKFRVGASFWGLVAVAVATVLGGIGIIPAGDYFRPIALAYTLALGPGLVLVYLLLKNEFRTVEDERSFMADLSALAITAAVVVYGYYLSKIPDFVRDGSFGLTPQWANNISTLLMLSFPALFVRARRKYYCLLLGLLAAVAAICSGSNGGLLFASVELVVCLVWLLQTDPRPIPRLWTRSALIYCAVVAVAGVYYFVSRPTTEGMMTSVTGRGSLFLRGFENFAQNPLFGTGFGYLGNADLYNGKMGAINWFHVFIAQVVGGLGICGILAWGYQLFLRARLALRVWWGEGIAPALCYLGLFLMSQVNPGEFCPVPYAFLAVAYFVFIENRTESRGRATSVRHKIKERKE